MKKFAMTLLALTTAISLTACGGSKKGASDPADVKGETYSAENISALCPEGWVATGSTLWYSETDETDPNVIIVAKGADSEETALAYPLVQITYYPDDMGSMALTMEDTREAYTETEDVETFTTGDYEWTGFKSTGGISPTYILWTELPLSVQVTIEPGSDDKNAIGPNDAEVQAILASIEAN